MTLIMWWLIVAPLPLWLLARRENRQIREAKLAARADEQHAALLAGDKILGIHGAYPPSPKYGWLLDESVAVHPSVLALDRSTGNRITVTGAQLARWAGENYGI